MSEAPSTLTLTACTVDLVQGRVRRTDGGTARLTTREVELLRHLASRPSEIVTRNELLEKVWGYDRSVVSRAPDVAMLQLTGWRG
jgi:DNA-binding response OmpR family regulator